MKKYIPVALILIFGFMGIFFFEAAREYGMREDVKDWCYGEFGHPRPRSFCDKQES